MQDVLITGLSIRTWTPSLDHPIATADHTMALASRRAGQSALYGFVHQVRKSGLNFTTSRMLTQPLVSKSCRLS